MNYLAHIFLSGENKYIQIGNFVGDAVKGKTYQQYPLHMQVGILLHRQIDTFSDAHPLVREFVNLGRQPFGRYSPVVSDILMDHFLAIHFQEYAFQSLKVFAYRFYWTLLLNYKYLPARFQGFLWHFILTNRLGCYASLEGVRRSLEIMVEYRGLQICPEEAIDFLSLHYDELQAIFAEFFPELQKMCQCELVRATTQILNS